MYSRLNCLSSSLRAAFALAAMGAFAAEDAARPATVGLRVLTFNVLVDFEKHDDVPAWDERKDLCAQVVKGARADVIALEECSPRQVAFFQDQLPEYKSVGPLPLSTEEIDAISAGLPAFKSLGYAAYTDVLLMYRTDTFEKLDDGHWWQSPTPEKVSTGFGNAFPRLAVWARLKHLPTSRELLAVATHFDSTMPAQVKMAALSHEQMKRFYDPKIPMLFLGDFNTDQKRGDYGKLVSDGWRDSYLASPKASPDGRDDNVGTTDGRGRIDHVFYRGDALVPKEWTRLESPDPGKKLSDHYPVFARFEWR